MTTVTIKYDDETTFAYGEDGELLTSHEVSDLSWGIGRLFEQMDIYGSQEIIFIAGLLAEASDIILLSKVRFISDEKELIDSGCSLYFIRLMDGSNNSPIYIGATSDLAELREKLGERATQETQVIVQIKSAKCQKLLEIFTYLLRNYHILGQWYDGKQAMVLLKTLIKLSNLPSVVHVPERAIVNWL